MKISNRKNAGLLIIVAVLFAFAVVWPLTLIRKREPVKIEPFPRTVWVKPYSVAGSSEKQWVLTLEWDFADLESAAAFCEQLIGWAP